MHTQGWRCCSVGRESLPSTYEARAGGQRAGDLMPVTLVLRGMSRPGGPKFKVMLSYIIASLTSVWTMCDLARGKGGGRKMIQQINVFADGAWQPQANLRTH